VKNGELEGQKARRGGEGWCQNVEKTPFHFFRAYIHVCMMMMMMMIKIMRRRLRNTLYRFQRLLVTIQRFISILMYTRVFVFTDEEPDL